MNCMTKSMQSLWNPIQTLRGEIPHQIHTKCPPTPQSTRMPVSYLEKDSDTIYDEYLTIEDGLQEEEEEYREDRMEQMIARHGY